MKYISFKILIACIVLPPLLYAVSVKLLESRLTLQYHADLKNTYLSDITEILNGQKSLRESVNTAVSNYLNKNIFVKLGGNVDVSVTTRNGNIIYPPAFQNDTIDSLPSDPVKMAETNFNMLNEGLDIQVEAQIIPYSLIAFVILLFYASLFLIGLYGYYHKGIKQARYEEEKRKQELDQLLVLEGEQLKNIQTLSDEREMLLSDYDRLQKALETEKIQAEKTEEELFDEIEQLEKKLSDNLSLQQNQHQEIDKLKEKIQELEKSKEVINKQKQKEADKLEKRFKTLYKNIYITPRALENLTDMTEEMGLKAEEIAHQLNDDASAVAVKRKVFSKKGNITAFEVMFAYSGRLYFRKTKENKVEILTIGTKNTQARDLAYLDSFS
ncbi:MAG: hypothetical protein MUE70_16040 [Desulfobacterales bacterium]|nr:hypothetical protein [Desulfobacterales bacterium]